MKRAVVYFLFFTLLNSCSTPSSPHSNPLIRPGDQISLVDPSFKACEYPAHVKIAHFPMLHYPTIGVVTPKDKELIIKSQFQLLQTILSKKNQIVVFDEVATSTTYSPQMLSLIKQDRVAGTIRRFSDSKSMSLNLIQKHALRLFGLYIPNHYENLRNDQKEFLFHFGASYALFFSERIRFIHQVSNTETDNQLNQKVHINNVLDGISGQDPELNYLIYDLREKDLKDQVLNWINKNGNQHFIIIAYGARHNFSDEFKGFSFNDGKHCLQWLLQTKTAEVAK